MSIQFPKFEDVREIIQLARRETSAKTTSPAGS